MFENRPNRDTEIVLVGRSNVGKSTLMRELTGHSKFNTGKKPGVSVLTRTPAAAHSRARKRLRLSTAALAAL